jgi:uncharacterized membrane protein
MNILFSIRKNFIDLFSKKPNDNWLPKIIFIFFGILYFLIVVCNHYYFRTFCYDYGTYNFAFYDYAHLRISECPVYYYSHMNFLQDHVSFTLMIFVPFYWIFGWLTGTYTLLFIQNIIILFGAWAIFKLILFKTNNKLFSILALLLYFTLYGRWTSFDEDCNFAIIASSMVPVFIYYFEIRKFFITAIVFIFILLSREDMSLWTFFIGIFLLLIHYKEKEYKNASIIIVMLSLAYFITVFKFVIPYLETTSKSYSLFNYSSLGNNPSEALHYIFQHPINTLKLFFINQSGNSLYNNLKPEFYFIYILSGGFLLFLRPKYFILFIPILAKKMFNDLPLRWSADTYYSIEFVSILPLVVFLIINDIKNKAVQNGLVTLVCISSLLVTVYKLSKHDYSSIYWYDKKHAFYKSSFYKSDFNLKKVYKDLKLIPNNAIVSATGTIVPHLAYRDKIYTFPKVDDATYIIVFLDRDFYPVTMSQFNSEILYYKESSNWNVIADDFSLLILKRGKNINIQHKKGSIKTIKYFCNADSVTPDKQMFISNDGLFLNEGNLQCNEKSHSGKFSIKLTQKSPYGMTVKFHDVEPGEIFNISVWRYAKNDSSTIAARINDMDVKSIVNFKDKNGWELIKKSFIAPCGLYNNELVIYLWNIGKDPVYFDDLTIVRENVFNSKQETY